MDSRSLSFHFARSLSKSLCKRVDTIMPFNCSALTIRCIIRTVFKIAQYWVSEVLISSVIDTRTMIGNVGKKSSNTCELSANKRSGLMFYEHFCTLVPKGSVASFLAAHKLECGLWALKWRSAILRTVIESIFFLNSRSLSFHSARSLSMSLTIFCSPITTWSFCCNVTCHFKGKIQI